MPPERTRYFLLFTSYTLDERADSRGIDSSETLTKKKEHTHIHLSAITMFPIDPAKLPMLRTRRGLMILDAQNDFLAEDGALPITHPEGLPRRIADLATAFREKGGDVIWVRSQFEAPRPAHGAQILTSDGPQLSGASAAGRGRRPRAPQPGLVDGPSKCPEAFLGPEIPERPKCVRPDTTGAALHPAVQESAQPRDYAVVKSHYSAIKSEALLLHLRKRLVTELFICGALTNISVMATAVDATQHGLSVAVVEDCCGYRSTMRHNRALRQIMDATGCDILTTTETLDLLQPDPKPKAKLSQQQQRAAAARRSKSSSTSASAPSAPSAAAASGGAAGRTSTVRQHAEKEEEDVASLTSALESSLEKLSLNSEPVVCEPKHGGRGTAMNSSKEPQPAAESTEEKEKEKGENEGKGESDRDEKTEEKAEGDEAEEGLKETVKGNEEDKAKGKDTEQSAPDSASARSHPPDPKASPPPAES